MIENLENWQPLARFDEGTTLPQVVEKPIEGLRLFGDGMQCRLGPNMYVSAHQSMITLKKHWRNVHYCRSISQLPVQHCL